MLRVTNSGVIALRGKGISNADVCLLERIDGFRSLEQILAISGDVIGLHATMGNCSPWAWWLLEGDAEPDHRTTTRTRTSPLTAKTSASAPAPQPKPAATKGAPTPPANHRQAAAQAPAALQNPRPLHWRRKLPPRFKSRVTSQNRGLMPTKAQSELACQGAAACSSLFNGDKAKKVIARIDACVRTLRKYST